VNILQQLQARAWLSYALYSPGQHTAKNEESARDNHVFACTLPNIHRFKKVTDRLSNKPFLIWLLTTPPHLKYVG